MTRGGRRAAAWRRGPAIRRPAIGRPRFACAAASPCGRPAICSARSSTPMPRRAGSASQVGFCRNRQLRSNCETVGYV
ncbi:hypothetical protein EGY14_20750 [Burkholderia pseudomallei]|nr:hypothetical protein CNX72_07250 [Burkholderia pseudomallei]AYX06241.1 hypothetical protein EGY14_20750 [Burkholderia pseudomallei]